MVTRTAPQQNTRPLWLGLLAGPLTWASYFIIGYLFVEVVCKIDILNTYFLGLPVVSAIILGLTGIGLFITIYAAFFNYRKWRQAPENRGVDFGEQFSREPQQFMALCGLLLSCLFAVIILLTGISVFILRPC
jgi:hypothetical protein